MIHRVEKRAQTGARTRQARTEKRDATPAILSASDALPNERAELECLYQNLPVGVCLLDCDFHYVKVNSRLAKINRRSIASHLGRTVREISPPVADKLEPVFRKVLETGEPVLNVQLKQPKSEHHSQICNVELCFYPLKNSTGKVIAISVIVVDIREREEKLRHYADELEKRVAERTATLQESVQSLEGVLYHVAHDLRAPLRAMQGLTTLLLEEYGPGFDEEGRDYANRIAGASSRMDALIRDLLAYGRLGHVELPSSELELEKIVGKALESLRDEITARHAQIDIQRPLPSVRANDVVLQQILWNLLSNALKFVAPGVAPFIRIWAEVGEENIRLHIQDNGIGIKPEHQERIFRVFERLHRPEDYPGTGIGLAIVAKGMERMGGHVGLESNPGEGSRFWIELPAVEAPKDQIPKHPNT